MKVKFGWAEEDSSLLTRNVVGWLGTHWTAITAGHTAPETHSLIHPPSEATSATYHSTSTHRAGWTCKYLKSGYLSNAPILLNYTSSIAAPTKVSWSATVHHTTTATESRNNNKNWNPGTSCGHPDSNYYCIILWESNLPSTHFETSTAAESAAPSAATIVVHFRAQYPIFRLQ